MLLGLLETRQYDQSEFLRDFFVRNVRAMYMHRNNISQCFMHNAS